ncbi:hypothetical protein [Bradyrhizobium sp. SSUT77]|uniref:hypothetical protein n=1 Tax=Bradyrhizobium sp. SSUT77 TaxID=3040603 RepID=UPI00244B7DBD|nr:hypothetical protein [Bradyrhizobium sp. SSUT77]MDH2348913.1 hypothetical protein [Bradyrhizobium sp. SSUT77]
MSFLAADAGSLRRILQHVQACAVNSVVLANARLLRASNPPCCATCTCRSPPALSSPRVSVGMAVKRAVAAGYLPRPLGLRHLIAQAKGLLDAARVFAGIIVLSASVVLLDALVKRAEKQFLV